MYFWHKAGSAASTTKYLAAQASSSAAHRRRGVGGQRFARRSCLRASRGLKRNGVSPDGGPGKLIGCRGAVIMDGRKKAARCPLHRPLVTSHSLVDLSLLARTNERRGARCHLHHVDDDAPLQRTSLPRPPDTLSCQGGTASPLLEILAQL